MDVYVTAETMQAYVFTQCLYKNMYLSICFILYYLLTKKYDNLDLAVSPLILVSPHS